MEAEYRGRVELIYKVFPLAPDRKMLSYMFGNPETAKAEILNHWSASKRLPGGEEINPELMRRRSFPYPYSMPVLKAVKAAEFQAGTAGHSRYFDRAQRAHLIEARNVADSQVLIDLAKDIGLDMDKFLADFESDKAKMAVLDDYKQARSLGVNSTPSVVISGRVIPGAVPIAVYEREINHLIDKDEK